MNISQIDKFYKIMSDLLDIMKDIIGDLHAAQLTSLSKDAVDTLKLYAINLDKKYLIETFINNSESHWDKILSKDDNFFINNSTAIFGEYADYDNFNALKIIFSKNAQGVSVVDNDTREAIRAYIFSLIKISIKYIFEAKGGHIEKNTDNGKTVVKITYNNKGVFSNINPRQHAEKWKVALW